MVMLNVSGATLSGMGSDGVYYEFEPGYSGNMPDDLVRRQGWVSKGAVEKQIPKAPTKTEKKKDKKIEPGTRSDSYIDELY